MSIPLDKRGSLKVELIVDEAVDKNPFKNPIVVDVDTPHDWLVKGKLLPALGQTVLQESPVKQTSSAFILNHALVEVPNSYAESTSGSRVRSILKLGAANTPWAIKRIKAITMYFK